MENFNDILEAINESEAAAVFLYCGNRFDYTDIEETCPKLIRVVDSDVLLKEALSPYAIRPIKTMFFTEEDSKLIKDALTYEVYHEKYAFSYPFGYSALDKTSILHEEYLNKLLNKAKEDIEIDQYIEEISNAHMILKKKVDATTILSTYLNGINAMESFYLKSGKLDKMKLMSPFLFCLKGTLLELCSIAKYSVAYGALTCMQGDSKKWKNHEGKYVLLSSFLSISESESYAKQLLYETPKPNALITIEFIECHDDCLEYMKKFNFNEENCLLYPADISKYSRYQVFGEALLPALYPIKIVDVSLENDVTIIKAQAPKCVSFLPDHPLGENCLKYQCSNPWSDQYTDDLCALLRVGLAQNISISTFGY